jgi:hypothetical protein
MTVLSASFSQVIQITTVSSSFASSSISSSYSLSSSYAVSASHAATSLTASYALNAGTGLTTGSTYPITASWAISASWAPTNGTGLATGSTYPITASWAGSAITSSFAEHADTATFALDSAFSVSASWAPGGSGTGLATGSTYPITASWALSSSWVSSSVSCSFALFAINAEAADFALLAGEAITATTASYARGIPTIKSGIISGSLFSGSAMTSSVVFVTPFVNDLYSVSITSGEARIWTVVSRSIAGFIVNSNSNFQPVDYTFWQAIAVGEYYS